MVACIPPLIFGVWVVMTFAWMAMALVWRKMARP